MCRGAVQPAQLRRFSEGKERITSPESWYISNLLAIPRPEECDAAPKTVDCQGPRPQSSPPIGEFPGAAIRDHSSRFARFHHCPGLEYSDTRPRERNTGLCSKVGGKYFNQTDPKTSHENISPSAPLKHPIHRCADPAREQSSAQERPTASLIRAVPGLGAFSAGSWSVWD